MTPSMVLAMIHDLPENSRWVSWFYDPARGPEHREKYGIEDPPPKGKGNRPIKPEEVDWYQERRAWPQERMLMALLINRIHDLIQVTGGWPAGKGPDFPVIGPADWRSEEPENEQTNEPRDKMAEFMTMFGYDGPIIPPSPPSVTAQGGEGVGLFEYAGLEA